MSTSIRDTKLIFIAIVALIFLSIFSSDSYLPCLPAIAKDFAASAQATKLSVTLYFLTMSFAPLVMGPLSDKYGRKPIAIAGLIIAVIGSAINVFSPNIEWLIIGRMVQGFGMSVGPSMARTLGADIYQGEALRKVSATISLLIPVVPALAPIAGGYIMLAFGWHANFVFILILTIIMIFFLIFFLPETNANLDPKALKLSTLKKNYFAQLKDVRFLCYTGLACIAFAVVLTYLGLSPFLMQGIVGLNPIDYSHLSLFILVAMVIGSNANRILIKYFSINTLVLTGSVFVLIGAAIMLLFGLMHITTVLSIMLPMVVAAAAIQLIFANSYAGSIEASITIGVASALFSALQSLGAGSIGSLAALIPQHNQIPMASVLALMGIAAIWICIILIKHSKKR